MISVRLLGTISDAIEGLPPLSHFKILNFLENTPQKIHVYDIWPKGRSGILFALRLHLPPPARPAPVPPCTGHRRPARPAAAPHWSGRYSFRQPPEGGVGGEGGEDFDARRRKRKGD